MNTMMSVCGVMCSGCPAYQGAAKGAEHQRRTVEAWKRIYDLTETPERISCGGCLGPDEELFHSQGQCKARQCCRGKGFRTCAECAVEDCEVLEKAQSVWDEVPELRDKLSADDFETYARPYCGHRERLEALRARLRTDAKYRYEAPCGLYCGACGTVLADKTGSVEALGKEWGMQPDQLVCHGCKTETVAVFCRDCTFRDCVASKGIEHCYQCDEFPCEKLVEFRNDKASHHSVVLRNLRRMREIGIEKWLEEQRLRWSCPSCGAPFFWYDTACRVCGAALRDCRAEESELGPDD